MRISMSSKSLQRIVSSLVLIVVCATTLAVLSSCFFDPEPNVTEIFNDSRPWDVSVLENNPNITHLIIEGSGAEINDSEMMKIGTLKNLEYLEILNTKALLLDSIGPLRGLTKLRYVRIEWSSITDLSPLREVSNLEEVYLENAYIKDLTSLSGMQNLRILNVSGNPLENANITDMPNLRELDIGGGSGGRQYFLEDVTLQGLSKLQVLWAWNRYALQKIVLKDMPNLRKIMLGVSEVSGPPPKMYPRTIELTNLPNVNECVVMRYKMIAAITPVNVHIDTLDLRNASFPDLGFASHISGLQSVKLSYSTAKSLEPLRYSKSLQTVDVRGTWVSDFSPLVASMGQGDTVLAIDGRIPVEQKQQLESQGVYVKVE